ncbi:MAG: HEPN domain-containing protein [Deltaproteobacteria bacterium]|nr:HEPN domain-containing protein [Deltaproteobacteria bacterium]
MTEENRRHNLEIEVARAEQALLATEALLERGLHADSVSRAYYAVFHFLRALLLTRGLEPRTHGGAIHLFNVELVRAGLMPASHNRLLAGLQRSRELADYDAAVTFSEDDARAELEDARRFGADARALLVRDGWLAG